MEWLLIIGGIVLLLAFVDKVKLFGTTRETNNPDDPPLTARETVATVASAGGFLLRSTIEATKGLPAAAEELSRRAEKLAADERANLAHVESPLGKSLSSRKALLSTMLETRKSLLTIQDELDADPELARLYEEVWREQGEMQPQLVSYGVRERLRDLGFGLLPINLRILSIPFLCHFTRIENLPSILEHGIVPVAMCPDRGITPIINDKARFDRRTNTSSVSIGHPNARMLYKYRQLDPDADWVVLAVNVATALHLDTLFCRHNAADGRISRLPDPDLQGNMAFQGMFERSMNYTGPARYNEPTDDQAEILIPRIIPPSEIQGVFFLSESGITKHSSACGSRAVFDPEQSETIFFRRIDGNLSHTARILRKFDSQIDELAGEFRRDPRLFEALDRDLLAETRSSIILGHLNEKRWFRG